MDGEESNAVFWQIVAGLSIIAAIIYDNRLITFLMGVSFTASIALAHSAKRTAARVRRQQFFNQYINTERETND